MSTIVTCKKKFNPVPWKKLWEVLRHWGFDVCPLLAVKSIVVSSDVCVRVERVKSQPFTVGVGLRHVCVLSLVLSRVNSLFEFVRQYQLSQRGYHCWKLQINPGLFGAACILWTWSSSCTGSQSKTLTTPFKCAGNWLSGVQKGGHRGRQPWASKAGATQGRKEWI